MEEYFICLFPIMMIVVPSAVIAVLARKNEGVPYALILVVPAVYIVVALMTIYLAMETGFIPSHAGIEPAILMGVYMVAPAVTFLSVVVIVAFYWRRGARFSTHGNKEN